MLTVMGVHSSNPTCTFPRAPVYEGKPATGLSDKAREPDRAEDGRLQRTKVRHDADTGSSMESYDIQSGEDT